jgi:hypothetical protein
MIRRAERAIMIRRVERAIMIRRVERAILLIDAACEILLDRAQRAVLFGGGQIAVQREDERAATIEGRLDATDLSHARQEGEDVAGVLGQRGAHGAGDRIGKVAYVSHVADGVGDCDREHPAGAFDHIDADWPAPLAASRPNRGRSGRTGDRWHRSQ